MKKILILIFLHSLVSCKRTNNFTLTSREKEAKSLLTFFNSNAYKSELGVYCSEVNNEGNVVSGKVFNVALSRTIYGLSYLSYEDKSYLEKAKRAAAFQLKNLIGKDSLGKYFHSFYDLKVDSSDNSLNLDIWQQAYGLCGLTELYRSNLDENLLVNIHQLHDSFVKRFHDEKNGGFNGNYSLESATSEGKTFQSLIYPITAYMENLWLIDTVRRKEYERFLKENIDLAFKKGWNENLGWVNIKFDNNWVPCEHTLPDLSCFDVAPGHNFQYASLFLRAKNWSFLTRKEQKKYYEFGIHVLKETLKKTIYPSNDLSQGLYSLVNPVSNKILDKRKTWWQHCEALIALSLVSDNKLDKEFYNLEKFFFNTFQDKINGGEYFFVNEYNIPLKDELKGSIGKSAYHTIEMIRFLKYSK